ncbi:MAG: hypothetical protein J6K39_00805 [Clostridia bacterium]|nr:hypothetical protein [Clostridia bacterium]
MENKRNIGFKVFATVLFAAAVFGMFGYICFVGDLEGQKLTFSCIVVSFLFSLVFVKFTAKKLFITLALAFHVVADCFLMLLASEENRLMGLAFFCVAQFFYLLFTLGLTKSKGIRIVNVAIRVVLCLLAYFIIPQYFPDLGVLEMTSVMYIINSFVTLLSLLICIKTQWLTFFGYLLFFACDIFLGLTMGMGILGITGSFADLLLSYPFSTYFYVPGVFLIAASSVWAKPIHKN